MPFSRILRLPSSGQPCLGCQARPIRGRGRPPGRSLPQFRGHGAVEFALLLPLLLLIAFGVLDLGRILHASITITNAAREGVRHAMQYPDDTAGTEAAVIAEAAGSGLD